MTECVPCVYRLSYLCCLGGGPGIELISHPGRLSMSLCDPDINSLARHIVALQGPGGVSTVKEPIRGRLNTGRGPGFDSRLFLRNLSGNIGSGTDPPSLVRTIG